MFLVENRGIADCILWRIIYTATGWFPIHFDFVRIFMRTIKKNKPHTFYKMRGL